jgi:hypothetical protein
MATEAGQARQALWARYDAGEMPANELDARLNLVDRAGDDPAALERALTGPLRNGSGGRRRTVGLIGGAAFVMIVVGGALLRDEDPGASGPTINTGGTGAVVIPPPVLPPPQEECEGLDEFLAFFEALDEDTPPASPALLSDPVALPEGYSMGDEDDLTGGSDPDIAMSVSAGNPPPVQILARTLIGSLPVTMRTFVYDSAEAAGAAGRTVLQDGVCTYGIERYDVPDRPEILGSMVSGPIPTTAFAGWRLAERRFTVAVQVGGDGGPEAIGEAQSLAGTIAGLELDAARTAPPLG